MKHETDWQIQQLGDGALKWTSPQGREYITHPENPARGPVPPGRLNPQDAETGTAADATSLSKEKPVTEADNERQRRRDVYTRLDERLKKNKHQRDDTFADDDGNALDPDTAPF
jgi:hypothetical protein